MVELALEILGAGLGALELFAERVGLVPGVGQLRLQLGQPGLALREIGLEVGDQGIAVTELGHVRDHRHHEGDGEHGDDHGGRGTFLAVDQVGVTEDRIVVGRVHGPS